MKVDCKPNPLRPWAIAGALFLVTLGAVAAQKSDQAVQQAPAQDGSQPVPDASQRSAPSQPQAASENTRLDSSRGPRDTANSQVYALTDTYSVTLSSDWSATKNAEIAPPAPLEPYAPFHLSGSLLLSNASRGAILDFATSNNPLIGHDSYWLDQQMHAPSGSGMSLLDFFFYYFFPPSDACMHQVLTTYAPASRPPPNEGPGYLQVYYSCPLSDTLSGFYSAQISSGIAFRLTDDGTHVLAPVGDFYVAPMEQLEGSGMTFFVFEAQGMNLVTSDAAQRFHLPVSAQGGQPDFFWAIGATSPFPFVADPARNGAPILHVAYARLGVDTDAKTEFMNILRAVRTH